MIQESFLVSLYNDWLHWALLSQALMPLQFQNKQRYVDHIWMPKRWQWVKPLEDVTAKQMSVANMFESPIQVAAELGNNFEDIVRDVKKVAKIANEIGVNPSWLIKLLTMQKEKDLAGEQNTNTKTNKDYMTVNEKRASVGLPPLPGGDAIYLPSSEIPAIEVEEE